MLPVVPHKNRPILLRKLPRGWSALAKDRLSLAALALVALGLLFLLLPGGGLQGVGGIVFGTGLTVLLGAWTNRQQLAKEANLRRKAEVYTPLHAELQTLRERLQETRDGSKPYLQRIDVPGWEPPRVLYTRVQSETPPSLQCWPAFKADARRLDVSEATRQLLNKTLQLALDYNTAVELAREPAEALLAPAIDTAITNVVQSAEYQQWQKERTTTGAPPVGSGLTPPVPHDWFVRIASAQATPSPQSAGHTWAASWVEFGTGAGTHQPATLGWILAGNQAKTVQCIDAICRSPIGSWPPPPIEWLQAILDEVWAALENHPTRLAVRALHEELFQQVYQAEKKVEDKLLYIQETYEGGPPPL